MTLLFDAAGQRKYLTPVQRQDFLDAARSAPKPVFTFCFTLGLTGCRISEALNITAERADLRGKEMVFETLKRRRRGIFRAGPLSAGVPYGLLLC